MKILIATPCYDNKLDSRMVSDVIEVIKECEKRNAGVNWDRPSSPMLAYNRNISCQTAIEEEYDWILFWDADISIDDPSFPFIMIATAFQHNVPVIAAPVKLKHPTENKWNFAYKIGNQYQNWRNELVKTPQEVDVIGTGIMLIQTKVLKELTPPWFTFIDVYDKGRIGFFPEDWNFCEKVKEKGYKIIVDNTIKTVHWGTMGYK